MKKLNFFAGTLALGLALSLGACSSDEPLQGDNGVAEYDQTRYMAITLTSPRDASARAFENGTTNENAVNRLDFLFYDLDGNPTAQPQTFTGAELKDTDFSDNTNGDNVARIWTSVVPVQVEQGKALPSQVICLVNASEARATQLKNLTLQELLDVTDGSFYNGDHFCMTNSAYYGSSPLEPGTVRVCATPINIKQLASSQAAALSNLNAAIAEGATDAEKELLVDIYVERSAAKVGLTLAPTAIEQYTLNNGDGTGTVTLTFVPQYWFMNATNKTMYSTKRFGIPGTGTSINMDPTFAQVNANFANTGMDDTWNAPTLSRSYWGCSPSYAANNFPQVSDNVNDLDGNVNNTYTMHYYSFNDVKAGANGTLGATSVAYNNGFAITNTGAAATGYIYTTETTTAISRIKDVNNSNPAASVGSAVLIGHYYAGTTAPAGEYPTFWIDTNDGENGTVYFNETNAKNTLIARNSFIYSAPDAPVTNSTLFVLEHPKKAVRDILTDKDNIAGRLVTLQLAEVPTTTLYYWNGTAYEEINENNIDAANAQLAAVGYLDVYNNGRAFFNIPVRHLGWPANNTLPDGTALYENGVYTWDAMRVGDLGIVRNHVYTINVTKIAGLGSGLRSDAQPIVPPVHAFRQYLSVRLNVLAWNVVPVQNVEL